MSKSIWKFPFRVIDFVSIYMPLSAEILTVQMQDGQPCIWALVITDSIPEERRFKVIGTGHPINGNPGKYIGTFQLHNGDLVFHLFETE